MKRRIFEKFERRGGARRYPDRRHIDREFARVGEALGLVERYVHVEFGVAESAEVRRRATAAGVSPGLAGLVAGIGSVEYRKRRGDCALLVRAIEVLRRRICGPFGAGAVRVILGVREILAAHDRRAAALLLLLRDRSEGARVTTESWDFLVERTVVGFVQRVGGSQFSPQLPKRVAQPGRGVVLAARTGASS